MKTGLNIGSMSALLIHHSVFLSSLGPVSMFQMECLQESQITGILKPVLSGHLKRQNKGLKDKG